MKFCTPLIVQTKEIPIKIEHEGTVIISGLLSQPIFSGETRHIALRLINRYYEHFTKELIYYCNDKLKPSAIEELKYRTENGYPFNPYELRSDFTVTYNKDGLLSLYTDVYEYTGGAHGNTHRFADMWHTAIGLPASVLEFFPKGTKIKKVLTDAAAAIAAEQILAGTDMYFDDYPTLMKKEFSYSNIYITETGLALFYQQYAIAPYAEGIPVFITPFDNVNGPFMPYCP